MRSTCSIDSLKADLLQILGLHEPSVVIAGHCLADDMEELSNEGEGESNVLCLWCGTCC